MQWPFSNNKTHGFLFIYFTFFTKSSFLDPFLDRELLKKEFCNARAYY